MIRLKLGRYLPRRYFNVLLYILTFLGLYCYFCYTSNGKMRGETVEIGKMSYQLYDGVDPFFDYRTLGKKDWHDYDQMRRDQEQKGPGEGGKAIQKAKDDDETAKKRKQLYEVNGYDGYASDLVSLTRGVKDIRHVQCKNKTYIMKLPSVSVIFPFHNEHNSTLLRSVHSVINRSPRGVVKEVILVDDFSTKPFLKQPLEDYFKKVYLDHIVKVVRTTKREGLIRARQIGARAATAEILIFLDAHSEANYNWLPPLIEPIALNYKTVVCPLVDIIDCETYEYRTQDEGARGSFDWSFNYKRLPLQSEDVKKPTTPFRSPVMAGGYFAISAKWFWELGGYDEGLDIWGGEQYELSFKVWQCHGEMVDAPCSRVGHIYRCKYIPFPNPNVGDFISRNYKRVAEVWMDEYKEHLFNRRPELRKTDEGDLTKQKKVREVLQCKSFSWFLKEIAFDQDRFYPAVEPPNGAEGELKNLAANKCVDTEFKTSGQTFGLKPCKSTNPEQTGEQNMKMGFWLDIRPATNEKSLCFDVSVNTDKAPVLLFGCHGMKGNQHFKYKPNTKHIYHPTAEKCLDADLSTNAIFLRKCDVSVLTQRWEWQKINVTLIEIRNQM